MSNSSSRKRVSIKGAIKINVLGAGWQGTVWSVRMKSDKNLYALKQRLITKRDAQMKNTKSSSVLRELDFYEDVANRYPQFFSKLYDWEISPATDSVKEEFLRTGKAKSGELSSLDRYTHVFTTLSAMKDGTLNSVYKSLSSGQWYSMLAQVCYATSLLHERGYSHGDIWESNVAFEKVPWDHTVSIYRTRVPCFGFIWSIIDYGAVRLDVDADKEKHKRAENFDLDDMIVLTSGQHDATKYCGSEYKDLEKTSFRNSVLNSTDGPSVKAIMRQTGLPLDLALALLSIDGYLWHVCGKTRKENDNLRAYIDRGVLMQMSDARASYADLAVTFSKLARETMKS